MPLFPSAVITTANPRASEVGRHSKRIVVVRAIDRSPNAAGSVRGASPPKQAAISGCACLSTADDGSMPRVRFSAAQHGWSGVTGTGGGAAHPQPRSLRWRACVGNGPVRDAPGGTGLRGSGLLVRGGGARVGRSSSADEARCDAPLMKPRAQAASSCPAAEVAIVRSRPHMASHRARSSRRFAGRPPSRARCR